MGFISSRFVGYNLSFELNFVDGIGPVSGRGSSLRGYIICFAALFGWVFMLVFSRYYIKFTLQFV